LEAWKQWTKIPLETRTLIVEGRMKTSPVRRVNVAGIDTMNKNVEEESFEKREEDYQGIPKLQVNKTLAGEPRQVLADKKPVQLKKSSANHVLIANTTNMMLAQYPPSNPKAPPYNKVPPHLSKGGMQTKTREKEASRSMFYIETEYTDT
jgi:hypothetical protein